MTVERRNPLPPGRYWVTVLAEQWPNFDSWLAANKELVKVEYTQSNADEPGGVTTSGTYGGGAGVTQAHEFVIFTVVASTTAVVMWEPQSFGFPNIAGPEIRSEKDVVQRPQEEPDAAEKISEVLDAAKEAASERLTQVIIGVFVVIGAVLIVREVMAHKGMSALGAKA